MADLTVTGAVKRFGATRAVDCVDLDVRSGELIALLGPSGCGKSTLLRLIAGFEVLDGGEIRLGDRLVSGPSRHVATEDRRVGMVFQSYALWPHMSVAQNVGFALRVQRLAAPVREARVAEALDAVGLTGFARRQPAELSGGQRQRVALARALAMSPAVVLLDEPLANLDAHLREAMQEEFRTFHERSGATMVAVTHDQAEALALADRVAVMMDGRIRQFDTPRALYACPADVDVARFIGRGSVLPVEVVAPSPCGGAARVRIGGAVFAARAHAAVRVGPALACLRPEACEIVGNGTAGDGLVPATVARVLFAGARLEVTLTLDEAPGEVLRASAPADLAVDRGDAVGVRVRDAFVIGPAGG